MVFGMKRKRCAKMLIPEFFEREDKDKDFWYDETPGIVEVDGECYDTVIVEGWQPEFQEYSPDVSDARNAWSEEGELLAEICVEQPVQEEFVVSEENNITNQEEQTFTDSDDCTNLSWLMNFKVDDILNQTPQRSQKGTDTPKSDCWKGEDSGVKVQSENKPPFTYTKLIELALRDKGELTVSGIYRWISERFPFFKPHDDRWKNSVRHNLSINPHFRKGPKAPRGAGHLWGVATPCNAFDYALNLHKRVKSEPTLEQEVAAAAASILQQHPSEFINPVTVEQVAAECGLLDSMTFTY